jgi:RimJ/RimL family protein N-acetyltransferase
VRHQEIFFCNDLNELCQRKPDIPILIEDICSDNVERVTDFREESKVAMFRRFLEKRQVGVFAVSESRVIGHGWAIVCEENKTVANGYFKLDHGESFIHFCSVAQSCRSKGIYQFILYSLCERLFESQKPGKVYIDCEVNNIASIKGIEKVGFQALGRYHFYQIMGQLVYKKRMS